MLALAPDTVEISQATCDGHWFTDTALPAGAEAGERGVAIALDHLRSVLGLAARPENKSSLGDTP